MRNWRGKPFDKYFSFVYFNTAFEIKINAVF